jgi:GH25 family lysozyme M1 (1,4-beta-N-acetylmuramidase)
MSNPKVIDISHHQPDPIDWAKVKNGGTLAVIHKATEGTTHVDEDMAPRQLAATQAGLSWSTYHFLRPGNITQQMDFYLQTADPPTGSRVCLDHEDEGVSLDDLKSAIKYLGQQRPDLQITLYSGHLIEEQLNGEYDHYLATSVSLWTAQYTDRPSDVDWNDATWPKPSLWQYSDQTTVDGIDGPVDGNKWNGSDENLVKWFGPPTDVPEPKPPVTPIVEVSIYAPKSVALSVTVNGEPMTYANGEDG